jgi:ribose 5-phosphate isomerase B
MPEYNEQDLHMIVQRVLQRTLGNPQSANGGGEIPSTSTPELNNEQKVKSQDPQMASHSGEKKVVSIGSDHGGYEMKESLKAYLQELGYSVSDCGTNSKESVDYPDFALAVSREVAGGKAWRGIVIDGAGIGSCMTANKVRGIRAAMAYDYASALNSREHNDANVLTLGAGLIGLNQAKIIVKTWLSTDFLGGRHARRVEKILIVEKQYLKEEK